MDRPLDPPAALTCDEAVRAAAPALPASVHISGLWFTRPICPANARCAFVTDELLGGQGWVIARLVDGTITYVRVTEEPDAGLTVSPASVLPPFTPGPWDGR
jgi:hypothetical protein